MKIILPYLTAFLLLINFDYCYSQHSYQDTGMVFVSESYEKLNNRSGAKMDWDTLKINESNNSFEFKNKTLSYNGKSLIGDIQEFVDAEGHEQINEFFISPPSTRNKYFALIGNTVNDYTCLLFYDIEKNSTKCLGIPYTYIWTSWSPEDDYSIYMWGYEGDGGISYYDHKSEDTKEFDLSSYILKDSLNWPIEQLIMDEMSLEWVSTSTFRAKCWIYCNPYVARSEDDCIEWIYSDWMEGKRNGKERYIEFNCSTGKSKIILE